MTDKVLQWYTSKGHPLDADKISIIMDTVCYGYWGTPAYKTIEAYDLRLIRTEYLLYKLNNYQNI